MIRVNFPHADHLTLSWITCLFCNFLCLGTMAVITSSQSKTLAEKGEFELAAIRGKEARKMIVHGICLTMIVWIIVLAVLVYRYINYWINNWTTVYRDPLLLMCHHIRCMQSLALVFVDLLFLLLLDWHIDSFADEDILAITQCEETDLSFKVISAFILWTLLTELIIDKSRLAISYLL